MDGIEANIACLIDGVIPTPAVLWRPSEESELVSGFTNIASKTDGTKRVTSIWRQTYGKAEHGRVIKCIVVDSEDNSIVLKEISAAITVNCE